MEHFKHNSYIVVTYWRPSLTDNNNPVTEQGMKRAELDLFLV